jgi:RimJ/RimL family protein N-acetyltransferase
MLRPMFEHGGVGIRSLEERDLEAARSLRADPRVWMQLGDVSMISAATQQRWFQGLDGDGTRRYYALFAPEIAFAGIARMDEIDFVNRSVRIGGDVRPDLHGRGYGRRMLRLLIEYSFNHMNMHRVWLLVLESNERARALYAELGFLEEGRQREAIFRDGAYFDYVSMSLLRREWARPGAE